MPFLSEMSQLPFLSSLFAFSGNPIVAGTSMSSNVTDNPTETSGLSTPSATASQWRTTGNAEFCLIARRYIHFYLGVWYWIDLTLWAIAPFVTIIVSNVAIVVRLTLFDELNDGCQCSSSSAASSKTLSPSSSSSTQLSRTSVVSGRSRRVTSSTTMLLSGMLWSGAT